MSKGDEVTSAIEQSLRVISTVNGYYTDVQAVYPDGEGIRDKAPMPYLTFELLEDATLERVGRTAKRQAVYRIDAWLSRAASVQAVQRCHHDILHALGFSKQVPRVQFGPAALQDERTEFNPPREGGSYKGLTCRIVVTYMEGY